MWLRVTAVLVRSLWVRKSPVRVTKSPSRTAISASVSRVIRPSPAPKAMIRVAPPTVIVSLMFSRPVVLISKIAVAPALTGPAPSATVTASLPATPPDCVGVAPG